MKSLAFFFLLLLLLSILARPTPALRVAIVGAGIGGSSAAWYLQNFTRGTPLEGNIDTTLFESLNRPGGRLYAVEIGGQRLNVGGDAWAQVNWYVRALAAQISLPLETQFYDGNGLFGLYQGDGRWDDNATALLLSASSDAGMLAALSATHAALAENYLRRGALKSFRSVPEFLKYGDLGEFTTRETGDFLEGFGVDRGFVERLVGPLCQVIYDQTPAMQAFAGMVSVLSATSTPYSALNGNDNLPISLLRNISTVVYTASNVSSAAPAQKGGSTSLYLSTTVRGISLAGNSTEENPQYAVEFLENHAGTLSSRVFDAVIIAAPLEFTFIDFAANLSLPAWSPRRWVEWVVTLVEAEGLQPSYFGRDPVPDEVIATLNSTAPFAKVTVEARSNRTRGNYKIYSLFSVQPLEEALLDAVFVARASTVQYDWPFTFPVLDVISDPSSYQPLQLHARMFSNNAMESVASAMEGSTIAARNSVLLLIQSILEQNKQKQ